MKADDRNEWARLVVSAGIMAYFGYALMGHWSNGIEETLKSAFMILVGYWLGSSKGSADKMRALSPDGPSGKQDDPVHTVEEGI